MLAATGAGRRPSIHHRGGSGTKPGCATGNGIGLGAGSLRPGMTPAATKLSKLSYRMTTNTHSAAPAENSEI